MLINHAPSHIYIISCTYAYFIHALLPLPPPPPPLQVAELWGTALRVQEALWVDLTIKSTPLGEVNTTGGVTPAGGNINSLRGQVGQKYIHTPSI